MWTTLGVLLFVLASAGAWRLFSRLRWSGKPRTGYEVKANTNKGSLMSLDVGVRTRTALAFELKHETWFDRAAKAIGLAVEEQLGRTPVDEALYLVTDDPRVASALRADRDLVDALRALFQTDIPEVRKVARVVCRDGVLVRKLNMRAKAVEANRLADLAAPPLVELGARLASTHPGTPAPDPVRWRATLVLALATGVFAHGLIDAFRLVFDRDARTIETAALWMLAWPVAAIVVATLAALAVALVGRSSRAHLVLANVLWLGLVGAPLGAMAEVRDYNMEADTSAPQRYAAHVLGKYVHHSSKGGPTYYVQLGPWPGQPGGYELTVTHSQYTSLLYDSDVTVLMHPGRLGLRWIEAVEPSPL